MAWGSESALEKGTKIWEVDPTEDVIQAFMETLVDPRLPLRVSVNDPPSQDAQKSVARQMHAVVLLYNYYHRKQEPELKFLDFVSFCKLALQLRPSLIAFMKSINQSESMELEHQLSVTEKAIKDACDIAMMLDVSKDVPTTEGCPISKVAVLLIDSKKENCLLRFGAVTEGVWSPIEKELNESNFDRELLAEGKKRKRNASADDSKFLQLGYDAVKDITGFDSSDLVVLETHVTYSLSKEKSAARFYMMQCPRSFNINEIVPLQFLVESLQGPLAEKDLGSWTTTALVEYYHMFPYLDFISCWLPRKDLCLPSLNGYNARTTTSSGENENTRSSGEDLDQIDNDSSETKGRQYEEIADESSEDNKRKYKHSSGGKVASPLNKKYDTLDSAQVETNGISPENLDNDSYKLETGSLAGLSKGLLTRGTSQNSVRDENVLVKTKMKCGLAESCKEENRICSETSNDEIYECLKVLSTGPSGMLRTNTSDFTKTCSKSEDTNKKLNSKIGVYHQRRNDISTAQHDVDGREDDSNLKLAALNNIEVENELDSEDLENALALLYRKRQELYSQICTMEDKLASYEDNIERIRDGGEVDLAHQCIKSILCGNNHLMLKNESRVQHKGHQPGEDYGSPQSEKQSKFSEIFFPGKSSCQDLEYICLKNNWRLPKYFVEPSDGKFLSNVAVGSNDFKISSKGGLELSPCEARESAAAQMIIKIRNGCDSNSDQS